MGGLEFEIRCVSTIENCFVSLPLSLIQTLQQSSPSSSGFLPHLLTLELRSLTSNVSWLVAWSGDTSSCSAVEVSQQFAECIALPNRDKVQVRVVSNIPKATLITIVPLSEDDWEVMELNSEHAEGAILKQVRVLHESMRFPLWLHGRTVVTFRVVSTFPGKSAVQLVAGTEVAVAPKSRLKQVPRDSNHSMQASCQESQTSRALLRVQDQDTRLICKRNVKGIDLGIVLTSIAFVHPESAKNYGLDSYDFIIIIPSKLRDTNKIHEKNNRNMKNGLAEKEVNGKISTDEKGTHHAIVHFLLSASVAKGHIMISHSLRAYLGAGLHSWVHVKGVHICLNRNVEALSISPACFKPPLRDKSTRKYGKKAPMQKSVSMKNVYGEAQSTVHADAEDLSTHDKVVNALSYEPGKLENEANFGSNNKRGLQNLLQEWFLAHLDVISSNSGKEINSLILGSESLLHFEVNYGNIDSSQMIYGASNGSLEDRDNNNVQNPQELIFLLRMYGESVRDGRLNLYQLVYDESINGHNHVGSHGFSGLKLDLGDPVSLKSTKDYIMDEDFTADLSVLSWMQTAVNDVVNRLTVLLSSASVMWFGTYALPLPGHVLIYGPPGSGKTLLARGVAKTFESCADILAHIVFVRCSKLALEKAPTIRDKLSSYIFEALNHAPSVLILDDLDSIISTSSELEGTQPSASVIEITEFLTDLMDEYGEKRKSTCGVGPIAFIATVRSLDKIPVSLSSSGRFDFHVQLPAPSASEREAILKHEIQRRSLHCAEGIVKDIAFKCDGYDAYDLEVLVDRTIHASLGRFLPYRLSIEKPEKLSLLRDDFARAMHGFLPVAMREISNSAPESACSGWDDVGGLTDICNAIKEMIELPSKFPNVFARAPLRLRSNILLYGPPGCGKTHIVGAAASACSLRFISVKGPELLNKYIGASEQAVRDIFSKAAAAAPCLLFFDEFDSIAPKRGHDNTGVTDRVVNQFLTELDGVEVLTGVFVFAATSRPDLLDAALLRPGRLDRLLFCDFPSRRDRLDILTVLSRKLPLSPDVDLDAIASMTEGFSGADLQALLSDAQLAAVHHVLDNAEGNHNKKMPVITDTLLKSVASKARPSVSEAEKQRLYSIYSQFLDSKRSVAAQSRDAKGKKATLA